jgi:hypothetical protein
MLLNSFAGIPHTGSNSLGAMPVTNATTGSLSFADTLVGDTATTALTVANAGGSGSALSGTFPAASGAFYTAGTSSFGPLAAGGSASQDYAFTPVTRGSQTQSLIVGSNVGNVQVNLVGQGVAPVATINAPSYVPVRIGDTAKSLASFTVTNTGDGNLSGGGSATNLIGNVSPLAGGFYAAGGSFSLADGASSQTFTCAWLNPVRGSVSTPAVISTSFTNGNPDGTNHAYSTNVTIPFTGVGPVYSSDIAPNSTLAFGTMSATQQGTLTLNISNTSTDNNGGNTSLTDLTLVSALFSGDGSTLFSLPGFTPGAVLHAGDSPLALAISYDGQGSAGDVSATLTITTDEGAPLGVAGTNSYAYNITASLTAGSASIITLPEPSSLALLAAAGLSVGGLAWRRRRAKAG